MSLEEKKSAIRAALKKKYPSFNPIDYDTSIRDNLAYYRLEEDDDLKKTYALLYWERQGKDVKSVSKLDKGYFCVVGALSHMVIARELSLSDKHLLWLDKKYHHVLEYTKPEKEKVEAAKKDIIDTKSDDLISELEVAFDSYKTPFDVKGLLARYDAKPSHTKKIIDCFSMRIKELQSISGDEYLEEAYSNFSKMEVRNLIKFVQEIIDSAESYSKSIKQGTIKRASKAKPPSILCKDITLTKECKEASLKGLQPERIIGASEAWFYDVDKRRLIRYSASSGMKLTVKGKTIQNFDEVLSMSKIIRKPTEQLIGAGTWNKKSANAVMMSIKATSASLSGRVNEKMLLICVF